MKEDTVLYDLAGTISGTVGCPESDRVNLQELPNEPYVILRKGNGGEAGRRIDDLSRT